MSFSLRHIPALFQATAFVVGGVVPYFNPRQAILSFGLPEHIAASPPAQLYSTVDGSRVITLGIGLWVLYLQGKLAAVDTILICVGSILGGLNGWICWKDGSMKMAIAHSVAGVFYIGWGWLGMTEGRQWSGSVRQQDDKSD